MELSGAWEKDPQRRRAPAPKSKAGIGNPPGYFSVDERVIWREIVRESIDGVLTSSDRFMLELACLTLAKVRRREEVTGPERSGLQKALSSLGMTPVDRTRLGAAPPEEPEASPYDEFRQR